MAVAPPLSLLTSNIDLPIRLNAMQPIDIERLRKELDESRLVGMAEDQLKAVMYQRMAIAARRADEKIAKSKRPILRIRNWKRIESVR